MKIKPFITALLITSLITGISEAVSDVELLRNMALSTRHIFVNSYGHSMSISQEENLRNNQYTGSSCKANWIAVGQGTGTFTTNKYEFTLHPSEVDQDFESYNFQQTFSTTPAFIATIQTHGGQDTAVVRYRNLTASSVEIQVQEEESMDDEMAHDVPETIGYMIAEPGNITAGGSVIGEIGSKTVSMQKDQWHPIELTNTYTNPIMVLSGISYNDPTPITVVLNNFNDKFYFQLSEWEYLDKIHPQETVSYVVIEAGEHVLDNGIKIKAGVTDAKLYEWEEKTFTTAFDLGPFPVLFSVPTFFMAYDAWVELAGNATISEDENTSFTIFRDTNVGNSTVTYETDGTAVNGTDYEALSESVTFVNGQSSATVVITPVDNSTIDNDRTINIYVPSLIREQSIEILLEDNDQDGGSSSQTSENVGIYCGENGYIDLNNSSDRAEIIINSSESGSIKIELYDMMGTSLWSANTYAAAGTTKIVYWDPYDNTKIVSGIYIFYINGAGIDIKKKIAVIK